MKHHEYPKWLYHKSEEPKLVEDKQQHEELGAGWEETPAAHKEGFEAPQALKDKAHGTSKKPNLKEDDLIAMTVAELKQALVQSGASEEDLKGLRKDELITMFGTL